MIVALRWVWTAALRFGGFVSHSRWIILSLVLAALGVLGVVVPLPPALNVGLALLSLTLVVMEIRTHALKLREIAFVDQATDAYVDVQRTLQANPRFEFVASNVGSYVIDFKASEAIAEGRVVAHLAPTNFRVPHELKDAGIAFRRRRIAEGATYNGHVVGLNTNLGSGRELLGYEWELVPGRYWDHLATDILATKEVLHNGRLAPSAGRQLYVARHGGLRDFADSWLLNAIGTSVLALTTDARMVLVAQSDRNESSRGLLAPAGSGSLEPRDTRGKAMLLMSELAANGALREMGEESGIPATDVEASAFLGFGRWLSKAGKPELFTLAVLSIDSHTVRRRVIRSPERPYTLGTELVRLRQDFEAWNPEVPDSILEMVGAARLSIPVHLGLRLMGHAVMTPGSAAGDLIRRAVVG